MSSGSASTRRTRRRSTCSRLPSQSSTQGSPDATVTSSGVTASARMPWRWAKAKDMASVMAATSIFSGSMWTTGCPAWRPSHSSSELPSRLCPGRARSLSCCRASQRMAGPRSGARCQSRSRRSASSSVMRPSRRRLPSNQGTVMSSPRSMPCCASPTLLLPLWPRCIMAGSPAPAPATVTQRAPETSGTGRGSAFAEQPGVGRGEFLHSPAVDFALEGHHLAEGIPVAHPAPVIELGLAPQVDPNLVILRQHAQQKPLLLLADADRTPAAPDQPLGEAIAQPAPGAGEHLDVIGSQPHLFVELAIQGFFGLLAVLDAALGKLPGILLTHAASPQYPALGIGDDDADIGATSIGVDHEMGPVQRADPPFFHAPGGPTIPPSVDFRLPCAIIVRRNGKEGPPRATVAWAGGKHDKVDAATGSMVWRHGRGAGGPGRPRPESTAGRGGTGDLADRRAVPPGSRRRAAGHRPVAAAAPPLERGGRRWPARPRHPAVFRQPLPAGSGRSPLAGPNHPTGWGLSAAGLALPGGGRLAWLSNPRMERAPARRFPPSPWSRGPSPSAAMWCARVVLPRPSAGP